MIPLIKRFGRNGPPLLLKCPVVRTVTTAIHKKASEDVKKAVLRPLTDDTVPAGLTVTQEPACPKGARPIYMDFQATTPLDPRVLDAMLPYWTARFGNPHSRTHQYGWECEEAVEKARADVATLIGAHPKEIVLTSGATEANNLALKGIAQFYGGPGATNPRRHIITTQTEHKCVLDSCRALQASGFDITYLPVQPNGVLDPAVFAAAIRPGETLLASVMAVNNEIGVVQPIKQLAAMARELGVFFHTDAAQAVGKIAVNVADWGVDCLSLSGHKLYGPKGIGALYVRRRPRVRLTPLLSGGGQERGLRSGTVPTPLVVGLGAACRLAAAELPYDQVRIARLARRLEEGLHGAASHVVRNGDPAHGYPGCLNFSFAYIEGESLLMALKDIALSSGSACTSASLEPSYVLRALGKDDALAHSSIRFGIGRFTTDAEIDYCVARTKQTVDKLRALSPLWEMVQDGIDLNSIQWSQH
jgi:cysteine desulfurase